MDVKKKVLFFKVLSLLLLILVILLISLPVVKVLNSSYSVIIKDKDLNYFRAGNLFICGDTILCRRDSETAKDKSKLPEENKARYTYKLLSMKEIISIEIVQEEETAAAAGVSTVNPQYLGRFKIRLQGHEGLLVIGTSKERLYATVRFPEWGKGAVETLKGVRISSGEIRFLRSASTQEEIRRLGANYLFKHKFSGNYNASGKVIRGFMVNDKGEKYEWEAEKK